MKSLDTQLDTVIVHQLNTVGFHHSLSNSFRRFSYIFGTINHVECCQQTDGHTADKSISEHHCARKMEIRLFESAVKDRFFFDGTVIKPAKFQFFKTT